MKSLFQAVSAFILLVAVTTHSQAFNSVRVAHIQIGSTTNIIPAGFLARARAANYTHVLAEFTISPAVEWSNGFYTGNGGAFTMRDGLRDAFLRVHSYGMRLIPEFQSGSMHSGHWANTANDSIKWEFEDFPTNTIRSDMPALAEDAAGFDRSFDELIDVIGDAYAAARVINTGLPADLEYLHIGHDEARTLSNVLLIGQSTLDSAWLAAHPPTGGNTSIQLLWANEISRRVADVTARLPNTTVLIWGDMLDPQSNGGGYNLANAITAPDLQATATRQHLVIIPWQYEACVGDSTHSLPPCPTNIIQYNSVTAFNHFRDNNYRILTASSLTDENNTDAAVLRSRHYQTLETMYISNLPAYRNTILGFVATNWLTGGTSWNNSASTYQQFYTYKVLEFLSHMHHSLVPAY